MPERETGPIQVGVAGARLLVDTRLPDDLGAVEADAVCVDRVWSEDEDADGTLFVALEGASGGHHLVVTVRYGPAGWGFSPGVLFVPETEVLFVGAGTTVLCYSSGPEPRRIWVDQVGAGFWSWQRIGDRVLMAAELELAAWGVDGRKLWSTYVEPPWDYTVDGDTLSLDVMGTTCDVDLVTGPDWEHVPWR